MLDLTYANSEGQLVPREGGPSGVVPPPDPRQTQQLRVCNSFHFITFMTQMEREGLTYIPMTSRW